MTLYYVVCVFVYMCAIPFAAQIMVLPFSLVSFNRALHILYRIQSKHIPSFKHICLCDVMALALLCMRKTKTLKSSDKIENEKYNDIKNKNKKMKKWRRQNKTLTSIRTNTPRAQDSDLFNCLHLHFYTITLDECVTCNMNCELRIVNCELWMCMWCLERIGSQQTHIADRSPKRKQRYSYTYCMV